MIRNYIKIIYANLVNNKSYSIISISSLAIGMAVCILLLTYVSFELSYDRYHKKADHIYRLCQETHPYQAPQAAKLLADNLPEIKEYTRILARPDFIVQYSEKRFKENEVAYVDAEFFDIFSFKFIRGDAKTALKEPATIVISETIALKYFGNENPMGKALKLNNEKDCTVTGVIEDLPLNSHFRYEIFLSLTDANALFGEEWMHNWGWLNFLVYFEMQDHFSKSELEAKISQLIAEDQNEGPDSHLQKYTIQQLKDIHLYSSHFTGDIQPQNSITYVLIFSAIGLLILLIACFNYINLITANTETRATEIGIRKSYGANRKQLALQFIAETLAVLSISFFLAFIVVGIGMPLFNKLSGNELSLSILKNLKTITGIITVIVVMSIISGWYPVYLLLSSNPSEVLKATKKISAHKSLAKNLLTGAQFTIVIILIYSAMIMFRQINFLQNKDLGFNKEAVLTSVVDFGDGEKYNTLKHALLDLNMVSDVSSASRIPSGSLNNLGKVIAEGQEEGTTIPYVHVNFDYFEVLGIQAAYGRLFSDQYTTDATHTIILNEAAVKSIGIQGNPIGQTLKCNWPVSDRKIIGVINDFYFESLYNTIKPAVFVIHPEECYQLILRVEPRDVISSIRSITDICQSIYPYQVFDFHFLDTQVEQRYQKDKGTFRLMGYLAALAIILASMGLIGMASFIIIRRTKEIGIRKVNGARVSEVMKMLNLIFVKWVAIAFVLAIPIAYFFMKRWLESFAYRTMQTWWILILVGFISISIVLITVSWITFRAARRNPIESLKYE